MESENQFAATLVIIGLGKNVLEARAIGEGMLGDQDLHPVSKDHPTACLVISNGEKRYLCT